MDLSKLSTEDLMALKSGDLSKMSTEGLVALKQPQVPSAAPVVPQPDQAVPTQPEPAREVTPEVQAAMARLQGGEKLPIGKEGLKEAMGQTGNAWDKFTAGIGSAPAQAYQGVKQLVGGDVAPEDIEAQRAVASTGPGMVGNIAGNIAMTALPMGAAEKGIRAASVLPKAATRLLAAPTVSAAEGALAQPTLEGESRAKNAAINAALTGGTAVAGKALTGLIEPTKEALALIKKGIMPTVGQGSGSKALKYAEDLTESIPIAGGFVKSGKARAERELTDAAARRAHPNAAASIADYSRGEHFQKLEDTFDKSYKELLKNETFPIPSMFRAGIRTDVDKAMVGASRQAKRELEEAMSANLPQFKGKLKGLAWKDMQSEIRRLRREEMAAYNRSGNKDSKKLADAYDAINDHLERMRDSHMPPEAVQRLKNIDEAYAHNELFKDAASFKKQGEKGITVENLVDAVEQGTPRNMKVKGQGRYQDLTEPAKTVFKKSTSPDALERRLGYWLSAAALGGGGAAIGGPAAVALPALMGISSLGASRQGAKLAFGQAGWQKMLANALRNRTGSVGASLREAERGVED